MPTPAQWLRNIQRRFGIMAPKVTVRTHLPWYWRWLALGVVAVMVMGLGWQTFGFGIEFAGFRRVEVADELARLSEKTKQQEAQLAELRTGLAQAERQLDIERATYGNLAAQVKALTDENATLKEDLAFFQSLSAGGREGAISVNRFQLQADALPGEYRYRLLLVQSGQRNRDFRGSLQFVLNVRQNDRPVVITLPAENERENKDFQLSFRLFQRIEGSFRLPAGAVVQGMQVRVFEAGSNTPKLTQTLKVS